MEEGLRTFHGAGRRFEYKGSYHGAAVFDDYAHHPGELHALLTTARSMPYKRIICAFQPHGDAQRLIHAAHVIRRDAAGALAQAALV